MQYFTTRGKLTNTMSRL